MVRRYVKKGEQHKWSEDSMEAAIEYMLEGKAGACNTADLFDVPKTTLQRRVAVARAGQGTVVMAARKSLGRFKSVFTREEEAELAEYCKNMEARLFGLTTSELRSMAYQLAERNVKAHDFNAELAMAGRDWLSGFMKRNPTLSLRAPEPTSAARAMGFNKVVVGKFYELLGALMDQFKFTPDRIWNVDETGIATVPKSQSKVIALKGRRQVGILSSAERGTLTTAEICFSAVGTYMPTMLIFPRVRENPQLLNNGPPGCWAEYHESGWIQMDIFHRWFKEFVKFSGASKEKPVLLLLDGHATHTKSLYLIDLARQHNVILLCFPPHCTHRLQPLDVSFMKPLSNNYSDEVRKWLRNNPGRVVTIYQIAELFGKAFIKSASMQTAVNGFKKTGSYYIVTKLIFFTNIVSIF